MGLPGEEAPSRAALAEGLERRQPLHGVQKLGAVGRIGRLPRLRRPHVPMVEGHGCHQGEQGEAEEDPGEWQVEEGGEGEDAEGRDRGDEELRQVLAEVGLQLLDAVDHAEQHFARALAAELAGAQGRDLVEEPRTDLVLHEGGGVVRRHGAPVLEHAARQHGGGHGDDGQDQVAEALALKDPPQQPAEQREPRDPDRRREQAEHNRARDAQPQALGELPQPGVEIHARRPSIPPPSTTKASPCPIRKPRRAIHLTLTRMWDACDPGIAIRYEWPCAREEGHGGAARRPDGEHRGRHRPALCRGRRGQAARHHPLVVAHRRGLPAPASGPVTNAARDGLRHAGPRRFDHAGGRLPREPARGRPACRDRAAAAGRGRPHGPLPSARRSSGATSISSAKIAWGASSSWTRRRR